MKRLFFVFFTLIFMSFCSAQKQDTKGITRQQDIKDTDNYDVLIMSDPQPYRLDSASNDPNADYSDWKDYNRPFGMSLGHIATDDMVNFMIINGDVTEFGRNSQRAAFKEIYSPRSFVKLLFYGLGNHDYENNVNDCQDGANVSYNACARGAVFDVVDEMRTWKNQLKNFSYHWNYDTYVGSASYSWDVGKVHYVQLNNYPSYNVVLEHWATQTMKVTSSESWLEEDLKQAQARGLVSILNTHYPQYDTFSSYEKDDFYGTGQSAEELNKISKATEALKQMVQKYDVIALFAGHTHNVGNGTFAGKKTYNSGALFKGDMLRVAIRGKCIENVKVYKLDTPDHLITEYPGTCS